MKKTYIQPASTIIVLSDALCSFYNGASVVKGGGDGSHVDNIEVKNEDESKDMDWGPNSWGGD